MSIAFYTIAWREVHRVLRIWQQTLLPPAITTFLYFVIFGTFVGSRIGNMEGVSYITFITPGLIMMTIVTNSYSNVASSLFSAKLQTSIEAILFAPVSKLEILFGYVAGGMVRGIVVGCLVVVLSLFFVDISIYNVWLLVVSVLLSAYLFALLGFINGLFARKFDDIAVLSTFIITPLIYMGGVFFTIQDLSSTWQTVAYFNPMFYVINLFRYCLLGSSDITPSIAFMLLLCANVIFTLWALYLMRTNKRLRI